MSMVKDELANLKRQQDSNDHKPELLRSYLAMTRQIRVGILGAGFAGLRCADILAQYGVKVTIVEARDRLGGRVAQSSALGHKVDLGPNWIHGSNDNPIVKIARETKTILHEMAEESSLIYDSEGGLLAKEETDEYGKLVWDEGLIAEAFAHSNAHHSTIDPETSLATFFQEKVQTLFTGQSQAIAKREKLLQYAALWGSYVGSDYTKQSLRNFWLEECIEGENPFVAETYYKILDAVAAAAKANAVIRLSSKVVKIEHSPDGHPRASLILDNEQFLDFEEIVVTAPLGWLKRNKSAFEPPLTEALSSAIDRIGYGTLDKLYVSFPAAFWAAKGASPELLQWLEPRYSEHNPHGWGQQGINLAALPGETAKPVLLFYVYGDCAAHIGQLVRESSSKQEAETKLLDFIKPYYALLPGYDGSSAECQPDGVLATTWVNDEFAGYGSYSNFQVPLQDGAKEIEIMRHGMPESSLWFAGEHTAPFIAMGTTTGAYWSGEAVAHRIAKAYGLVRNDTS